MPDCEINLPWNFFAFPQMPSIDFHIWCFLRSEWDGKSKIIAKEIGACIGVEVQIVTRRLKPLRAHGWVTKTGAVWGNPYPRSVTGAFLDSASFGKTGARGILEKEKRSPAVQMYEDVAALIQKHIDPNYDRLDCEQSTFVLINQKIKKLQTKEIRKRLDYLFSDPNLDTRHWLDTTGWSVRKIFSTAILQGLSRYQTTEKKERDRQWKELEKRIEERFSLSRSSDTNSSESPKPLGETP